MVVIKSSRTRYYIRSDREYKGFIIHPHNYQKNNRKMELEKIDTDENDNEIVAYTKLDHSILFDSDSDSESPRVYLVLANPDTSHTDQQKLYFSMVRMNDDFGKEGLVVWWIYLSVMLMAVCLILVLGCLLFICCCKTVDESTPNLSVSYNEKNLDRRLTQSQQTARGVESDSFKKKRKRGETKMNPSLLSNEYIRQSTDSRIE